MCPEPSYRGIAATWGFFFWVICCSSWLKADMSSRAARVTRAVRTEPLGRSVARLLRLLLPILRRCLRHQGVHQTARDLGHLFHRAPERGLVRLRRRAESTQLPHELN